MHDPNSLGFEDPGLQVFGSAHLFATPSENVVCQLTDENPQRIFCERREPEYAALYLGPTGTPLHESTQTGDVGGPYMTDPILNYTTWWTNGSVACLSEERGLTCKNMEGHGFFLSKAQIEIF